MNFPQLSAQIINGAAGHTLKATLGGSSGDFARTTTAIDAYDKGIRLNPDVYIKIEQVADIQRAKRTGKVGIIYSFEGADMIRRQARSHRPFFRARRARGDSGSGVISNTIRRV